MRDAFGTEAMVDGFEGLIGAMSCDPKDRHVLAAAAHGEASVILTFNLRDFPAASTTTHGVEALHPEEFLLRLLAAQPTEVVNVLREVSASFNKPPTSFIEFMASLTGTVSTFANLAADAADLPGESVANTPALEIADEDEALASFGEPGDWTNPAQVGFAWCSALKGDVEASKALTYDAAAFGDYQWAVEAVAERSLASKVLRAVDAPDKIAFMRFVPQVSRTSHVFEAYMTSMTFLTLVRVGDGSWRAWGLGPAMYAADRILSDVD